MDIITLDFETFYDDEYTLKKMTTEAYIRDARFEAHMLACVEEGGTNNGYVVQSQIQSFLDNFDWSQTCVIMHHAQLDGLILSHHYGVKPAFIFDTISMARIAYGPLQKCSLAALAKKFDLPEKTVPYDLFRGKRFAELSKPVLRMMGDGAVHDCALTYAIFKQMLPLVPECELTYIDKTVRTFTEPHLVGDVEWLKRINESEAEKKKTLLDELGITKKDLGSDPILVRLYEHLGVEVEYKVTAKGNRKPAFAKTDEFMQGMAHHENETVVALTEARLGIKSSLTETRSGRLLSMAERGPLCFYLHHAGAHTLRVSGGDKVNQTNFPRGSDLRRTIKAPEGKFLSIKDFRQIELRTLLWLAGDVEKLEKLEAGKNLYVEMAEKIFGRPIDKKTDEEEYTLGKSTVLGCGYNMGVEKFYWSTRARGASVDWELAGTSIKEYRAEYRLVKSLWKEAQAVLELIGRGEEFEWKCFKIKDKKVYAPNGSYMFFDTLQYGRMYDDSDQDEWFMYTRNNKKGKMYGGKLVENLNQFFARCIASDAFARIPSIFPLVMFSFDELVNVVRDEAEHNALITTCQIRPEYAKDIPIEIEGKLDTEYSK